MDGARKGAGKPKGLISKRTQLVLEKMEKKNYDPIDAMIDLALDPMVDIEMKIGIHKDLAKYSYPKVTNPDQSQAGGSGQGGVTVNIVNFSDKLKQDKEELLGPAIDIEVENG